MGLFFRASSLATKALGTSAVVAAALGWKHNRCRLESPPAPQVVVIFSGKRKCGKDFTTDMLLAALGTELAEIGRLSGPLKKAYAEENGLDYELLLSAGEYKERYRKDMIHWGVEKRLADPGYFARKVVAAATRPILIISDARRASDMVYFDQYPLRQARIVKIRVHASQQTRAGRGWKFTPGVDDIDSECGLDDYETFDFIISNDGDDTALARDVRFLAALLTMYAQQSRAMEETRQSL